MKVQEPIKLKIKVGDTVLVIAGDEKGKQGKVTSVDNVKNRAIVEGLNLATKHIKPTAQNPQANGIVKKEAPIHISNLKLVEPATGKATRVGRKLDANGKLARYSKASGNLIADPYKSNK